MRSCVRAFVPMIAVVGALLNACGSPNNMDFDVRRNDGAVDVRPDGTAGDVPRMDTVVRPDVVSPDVVIRPDIVTMPPDDGIPVDTGTGGMCVSTCTTHTQCSSSCPPVSTGTWCCQSGTCVFDSNPVCGTLPDVITTGDGTGGGETGTGTDSGGGGTDSGGGGGG